MKKSRFKPILRRCCALALCAALSLPVPFAGEGWWYAAEAILSLILLVAGLLACRRGGDGP